jgi:nucleotide-binding universal stress UspA family protein
MGVLRGQRFSSLDGGSSPSSAIYLPIRVRFRSATACPFRKAFGLIPYSARKARLKWAPSWKPQRAEITLLARAFDGESQVLSGQVCGLFPPSRPGVHHSGMTFLQPARVIVGVGDLADGVRPLEWALAEARRRGAQLHAVRAWRDTAQPGPWTGDLRQHLEQDAERVLVDALHVATGWVAPDFSTRLVAVQGDTADVLLRYADRADDVLVLGAGRHGPWWPFGRKTVQRCVHKAGCLVVVVPAPTLARLMPVRKLVRELHRDLRTLERA